MSVEGRADSLTHEHVFLGDSHDENTRRTLWVVGLTSTMMVAEIVAGTIFNSMALLADGLHMATHAGALAVAAGAYAFARRHASDPRFTFGTGKVTDLAGFASALLLGVFAAGIAVESIRRLLEPQEVAFTQATIVAAFGLAVNLASAVILGGGGGGHGHRHGHEHAHGHAHGHGNGHAHHDHDHHAGAHGHGHAHGRPGQDNNMRSAIAHVLADALTSVLAIAALLSGRYLGWVWLDPVMGIVGALVIASWSWTLMRDSASVLLDTADPRLEAEIRGRVERAGASRITDLHVWRVGPGAHAAIVSVVGGDADALRSRLSSVEGLAHLTVEAR